MIYLLSNYTFYNEKIAKIKFLESDIIVLFNHAAPIKNSIIKNHTNKWLFMRNAFGGSYWGFRQAVNNQQLYSHFFLIGRNNETELSKNQLIKCTIIDYNDISLNFQEIIQSKKNNKLFTTGFISFLYVYYILKITDICLINFTGGSSIHGKQPWSGHDYIFEQQFYLKNHICMI